MQKKFIQCIFMCLIFYSIGSNTFAQNEIPGAKIKRLTIDTISAYPGLVKVVLDTTGTLSSSKFFIRKYVYNDRDSGYLAIDTLTYGDKMVFYDYEAEGDLKSESYDVVTYDTISMEKSFPSEAHNTIYLDVYRNDSCAQSQWVYWNKYVGIDNFNYNIIIDGQTFTPNKKDTMHVNNVVFDMTYTYRVYAFKTAPYTETYSNKLTLKTTDLIQIQPENFYIQQITNNTSVVDFSCVTDTLADLEQHELWTQNDNLFQIVDSSKLKTEEITFQHNQTVNAQFYKIYAINTCHRIADSTEQVMPIILSSSVDNYVVNLNWNTSYPTTENYEIIMLIDGENTENFFTGNSFYTIDLNDAAYQNNEQFQFKVVASNDQNQLSISNEIIVSKNPKIKMYNAITPNGDGVNDDIGPIISNASVKSFEFLIYNKFGELIYTSTDENNSLWNGTYNGNPVSEGTYMYYVRLTTDLDKKIEKSGVIHVLYP